MNFSLESRLIRLFLGLALVAVFWFLTSGTAHAAIPTAGNEFSDLFTLLKSWCHGGLGKSIAIAFLIIGLALGCIRGSIIAAVACLAAAVSLLVGPNIIEQIFQATGG